MKNQFFLTLKFKQMKSIMLISLIAAMFLVLETQGCQKTQMPRGAIGQFK